MTYTVLTLHPTDTKFHQSTLAPPTNPASSRHRIHADINEHLVSIGGFYQPLKPSKPGTSYVWLQDLVHTINLPGTTQCVLSLKGCNIVCILKLCCEPNHVFSTNSMPTQIFWNIVIQLKLQKQFTGSVSRRRTLKIDSQKWLLRVSTKK